MTFRSYVMNVSIVGLSLFCSAAKAATLCVSSDGSWPCYTHIAAAVAAAAPGDTIKVGPGTYAESITVTKAVSITTESAIVDATGLSRGFFVDGMAAPGLSGVNISGFTIRNANFEGVLVLNASAVTLSNNTVTGNNRSISHPTGTCKGLEAFETNEGADCGEGIHLLGADHSIVTNNTSVGNSGGILLSDDTGATHHNLISFNTVSENPYACGITMASHVPFGTATKPTPIPGFRFAYGVYSNTVYGNRSTRNGLSNGGGAGVGIFASAPGTMAHDNVAVDNYLAENGLPGIAMHAHAPVQNLNDNMLVGNTVVSNGPDTQDAATPGTAGINIYSLTPVTGNMFVGNHVQNEAYDVAVKVPAPVQVQFNSLSGSGVGVANLGVGPVIATENWWSCPAGPGAAGCSSVFGPSVQWSPWLTIPTPGQPSF